MLGTLIVGALACAAYVIHARRASRVHIDHGRSPEQVARLRRQGGL
jgi:hypothetical protein